MLNFRNKNYNELKFSEDDVDDMIEIMSTTLQSLEDKKVEKKSSIQLENDRLRQEIEDRKQLRLKKLREDIVNVDREYQLEFEKLEDDFERALHSVDEEFEPKIKKYESYLEKVVGGKK